MSTLQRQPAMPNVIQEIRDALMRPVLEASHRRPPTPRGTAAVARADERRNGTQRVVTAR